jgi:hypothetical protein
MPYRVSSQEEFRAWLDAMPERIEKFLQTLPDEIQGQLDYSIASIDILEKWLLEKYSGLKPLRDDLAKGTGKYSVIDGAGCYVGETFRKEFGGEWVIELKDQEYAYLGIPGIGKFRSLQIPPIVYPITWVTTSIDRRFGNFIRGQMERYKIK